MGELLPILLVFADTKEYALVSYTNGETISLNLSHDAVVFCFKTPKEIYNVEDKIVNHGFKGCFGGLRMWAPKERNSNYDLFALYKNI